MSSSEGFHNSLPEEPSTADLGDLYGGDILTEIWRHEDVSIGDLFDRIRAGITDIQTNYAVVTDATRGQWQSLHRLPNPDGTSELLIWLASRPGVLHTLHCYKAYDEPSDTDTVRYTEYAIAAEGRRWNKAQSIASKDGSIPDWKEASLGGCALINLQEDNTVTLLRGKSSRLLNPEDQNPPISQPESYLNANDRTRRELGMLAQTLEGLHLGMFHEWGATGDLY